MNTYSKNVIFIKLGGSIITDKNKERAANLEKIRQLAKEIKQALNKTSDSLVLGHGGGSFPHPPAAKYKTKEGFINEKSSIGLAKVREACIELNLIVIKELIKAGVPAVTVEPFAFLTADNKKLDKVFLEPIKNSLAKNLVPVIYGDAISDSKIGCTIYSGETILNILAEKLQEIGYRAKIIIEVGKTEGVYDAKGNTIPQIDSSNYKEIKKILGSSESTDVTGGMLHKVEEAYNLARKGIPTLLISAKKDNLKNTILSKKICGTQVTI